MAATSASGATDPEARARAFTSLYDDHVSEVYQYIHRRCQDVALAEDLTQDVFLSAVRSFDDPSSISIGWLLRAARNRLIDVIRRQTRYTGKLLLIRGGLDDRVDLAGHWVDTVVVTQALETLSTDHRIALTLHYLDGYTVPALAEELGRSVKAAERLVERGLANLRNELGERHG